MATIEVSKDMAVLIDKCMRYALAGDISPIEVSVLYTETSAEEMAKVSRDLQLVAYGEKHVKEHEAQYEVGWFRTAQEATLKWLKDEGIAWERVS